MTEYYYKKLEGRLFTKNGSEYPKYAVGGLRYRSEISLQKLLSLNLNESCSINGASIKRVK